MIDDVSHVQCCFCGNTIVSIVPDPLELTIDLGGGEEQRLYCHHRCLRRAVYPSVPLFPFEEQ